MDLSVLNRARARREIIEAGTKSGRLVQTAVSMCLNAEPRSRSVYAAGAPALKGRKEVRGLRTAKKAPVRVLER